MTDSLTELGAFVRAELLPDDPQEFARDSVWSATFLILGVTIGTFLTAQQLLGEFCAATIPMVGSACTTAYANINQRVFLLTVAAVVLLVMATAMTYRGDDE